MELVDSRGMLLMLSQLSSKVWQKVPEQKKAMAAGVGQ
jgi:hypothetical protein